MEDDAVVVTSLGKLRGKKVNINNKNVFSFTGVPYADKPERFGLPKPCSSWNGTLNCTKESKLSYQPSPLFLEASCLFKGSPEDCLYLNIFTPYLKNEALPVIVYFHGGAFVVGGNSTKEYGPDILLSNHNVVLVTVNYRLGPFGFLNFEMPECPGNQGMHDQVMCLRWVQSNILHFGGDPSNVTIMGQSAGGMSTMYHIVSPLSRGLFKKVICLSGAPIGMPLLHVDRKPSYYAKKLALSLGISVKDEDNSFLSILNELKSLPAKKILSKVRLFADVFFFNGSPWIPTPDGTYMDPEKAFLPDTFENLVREGKSNLVESVLMGYTAQDGLCYTSEVLKRPHIWNSIQQDWQTLIPLMVFDRERCNVSEEDKVIANKLFDMFFGEDVSRPLELNRKNFSKFEKLGTLTMFKLPFYASAKLLHENGFTVYGYNFNYVGTMTMGDFYRLSTPKFLISIIGRVLGIPLFRDSSYGCAHADDLLYIFAFRLPGFSTALSTPSDKMTSANFKSVILSFANAGQPSIKVDGNGRPQWPPIFNNEGNAPWVALLNNKGEENSWEIDKDFKEDTVIKVLDMIKSRFDFKTGDFSSKISQSSTEIQ